MTLRITVPKDFIERSKSWLEDQNWELWVSVLATLAAIAASWYSYVHGTIIAYGDSESHLNIAKRVIDSLTPGFAQLGGIWLPLPHLLLVPFVYFNFLWRTGLAGSIVSGACFVVSAWYLYKTTFILTESKLASFMAAAVFISNPNILYLQSTPMTELTLIVFFVLSSYYFIKFMRDESLSALVASAAFGFCASLSRYDGWGLVLMEAGLLILIYFPWKKIPWKIGHFKKFWDGERYKQMEGKIVLFCTLALSGILLWLLWGQLILGDALYFTHSQFSAKSQQASWLARGELPGYHNIVQSTIYYLVTSASNIGVLLFFLSLLGLIYILFSNKDKSRWYVVLLLLAPFIFNVSTLYLGQSVIFIPSLTPTTYDWTLFNVRYGVMMVPFAAILVGYLFYKARAMAKGLIVFFFLAQIGLYLVGYSRVITYEDGVSGLSSAISKPPQAQDWFDQHYNGGLVLQDDFARTVSIIRSPVPMNDVIYVGNKPYWQQSLVHPQMYATWVIMQQNDSVWNALIDNPAGEAELYKYFQKVYTSPTILIFERNPAVPYKS